MKRSKELACHSRRKLKEAKFFFEKTKETYYSVISVPGSINLDAPECDYYFSAFVSAARSIRFIMNKEFGHVHEFKAWGDSRPITPDLNANWKKITTWRNRTLHEEPLSPMPTFGFRDVENESPIAPLPDEQCGHRFEITLKKSDGTVIFRRQAELTDFARVVEEADGSDTFDLLQVCEIYLTSMEQFLTNAEETFSHQLRAEQLRTVELQSPQ